MTKQYDSSSTDLGPFLTDKGNATGWRSCHESHPTLKVGAGLLRGGNCSKPKPGYDIYIGLDHTMAEMRPPPWKEGGDIIDIHWPIMDRHAPGDVEDFKAMIDWVCNRLQEGKKVHVGCIGGHGRTGLFLSAVLAKFGDPDAIATVRKLHCGKAVETQVQVDFLVQHYGVQPVEPRHASSKTEPTSYKNPYSDKAHNHPKQPKSPGGSQYKPFVGAKTIWSPDLTKR